MSKRLPLLMIFVFPCIIFLMVWYFWFSPVSTVIFVRHAERLNDADTTSISEEGIQRAAVLGRMLRTSDVKRIYVSEKSRTAQTAAPLATLLAITPIEIAANDIAGYADVVRRNSGGVTVIVGHSDNIPLIIKKLGISPPPVIERAAFDDLFVITVFRFRSTLISLKYGNPSHPI